MRVSRKPVEPVPHELEPMAINAIDARAALSIVVEQSSRLKHFNVPSSSRPGMLKHIGNLARRHRATLEVNGEQDPSSRRMRERVEYGLVRIQPGFRLLLLSWFRHD